MTKKHKPRSGSLAFYPRKRAKKETPNFKTFQRGNSNGCRPLNFLGYKAGMLHITGRDEHQKAPSYGHEIIVPVTAVECPALKVYGVRAYAKTTEGLKTAGEVTVEKPSKHLARKVKAFKRKSKKNREKEAGEKKSGIGELERKKDDIAEIRLLVHTQPSLTCIGKKKAELSEIALCGTVDEQLAYAKEKLGSEIKASEVFRERQFIDVKAVDKGKGFEGVVKRFGVKMHRPKAKKRRIVGSIGPWNPSTVMWTVARAGQMGYQNRTQYNKRIIMMSDDADAVNPASGFRNYGIIKNEYLLLAGSVPGPAKRAVALRGAIRKTPEQRFNIGAPSFISTASAKKAAVAEASLGEESEKAKKVAAEKKQEKKEAKSVQDEIMAAVGGEKEKREKRKQ